MKKRIISLLLVCMMILSLLPMSVLAVDTVPADAVAYVTNAEGAPVDAGGEGAGGEGSDDLGGGYYRTLPAAVVAATAGSTVSIVKDGTYPIPNPIDGVVIDGTTAGGKEKVIFDASKQTGQLAKTDGEITFKNVTFNFGTANYTGFQHPGKITFDNCNLNGFLTTYGDMTFKDCKLTSGANQYAINFYGGSNFNLSNCHFYGVDKNVYIYQETLDGDKNVTFTNCDFHMSSTESTKTKSAVMLNAPVSWAKRTYNVVLSSCTTEGGMNTTAADNVAGKENYQGLYGLKHINGSGNPSLILGSVTIDNAVVYSCPNFEKGEVTLFTADDLMAFAAEVKKGTNFSGKTVKLGANIDLAGGTWPMIDGAGKNITFDGQNHTISNMTTPTDAHDGGFFSTGSGCTIKNVNFDKATVVGIGRLGVVCGHGMCVKIENCKVTNSTVTAVVTNNDDGDKAGAICGYLSGESTAYVKNCTVDSCTITGYRDVGGAVGYAGGTYTVSGNIVKNTTVYFDKESNYNKYSKDSEFDANPVIGDQGASGTIDQNTATESVTVKVLTAGTVDVGEGDNNIEVIVEQKSAVDLSGEGVIENLDDTTKNAITTKTAVTGVKLTTEVAEDAGDDAKSGLQAVVDAAVGKTDSKIAEAIKTADTVNIEVKVNVVPTEFKTAAAATQGTEEVIGTVTFELKPTATVTVGEGSNAKSETVDVDNSMIDTSKPITVSIYTGFKPVKIVHTGEGGFEEVFRETGSKTFTYDETTKVCTLTISHFSALTAVAKEYVAQIEAQKYETLAEAFAAVNAIEGGDPVTMVIAAGTFAPTANDQFKVTRSNVTVLGAGVDATILDYGTFSCSGQAGLLVQGDNVTVKDLTVKSDDTSDASKNISAIKVSKIGDGTTLPKVSNVKLENVKAISAKSHGLNLHGVTNATIKNVTTTGGKCGISLAAADVTVSESTVSGAWGSVGMMYKTTYEYAEPVKLTLGTGNTIASVYSERTAAATGVDSVQLEDGVSAPAGLVAKIENKYYTSLAAAVNGAADNDTITLVKNIAIENKVSIGKNLTLDLNGFTIAPDVTAAAFAGDSVMKSGSSSAVPLIEVTSGTVTVKNGTLQNKKYARYVIGDSAGATLILENMTLIKKEHSNRGNDVIQLNGALKVVGTLDIQVAPCTLYWNSSGSNLTEGFTQKIWGGISFNSSANPTTCSIDFSKCTRFTITDDAEASGGTLTQAPIHLVAMTDFNSVTDWAKVGLVKVIGNSMPMTGFAFADSAFLKNNYPVKIGDVYYQSIDKAIECAESTDVIELVKDVTIAAPVNVTKAVSIDGKGFTLTLSGGNAIFNAKNNVNNDGISESLTVKNLKMVMNSDSKAQSGYAVIAGRGATGFAISFDSCSFKNMWCGAMLNGCGTGTVAPAVTIKNSTFENVAHGVSFAFADYAGKVTFTGNRMSGETDIQEVFTAGEYVKTPTVEVTDGYYTADPTAYLASGYAVAGSDVQGYAYMVAKVDLPAGGNDNIGVVSKQPDVDCGDRINPDYKETVKTTAAKTEVAGLGQDALKEAAKVNADSAKAKLIGASVEVGNDATVTVFAQTYLDVEPKAYDATESAKVYTVDITPMVQLIATTAENAAGINTTGQSGSKNAVALGGPTELKVTTPVVVTIPLPTGFAAENTVLFVKHTKGNGETYLYKCTVQKDANNQLYIQFVNNNGFSTFSVTATDTTVASITRGGSTMYFENFADAVAAVENDETIKLEANNVDITSTVSREVRFKLDKNGKTFSGSITPGANYKNTGSANEGTISYVFTYVAPSGGGGGVAYYAVSAASATHGKVTVDKASASAGSTVTITVAPEKGFTLETLTVKDAKGNEVALAAVKTGETYTFKMPSGKVTISATFMEDNTMLNFFVDVKADDYYYDAVLWAAKNGITSGVDATHFAPMAITTRGQMVTFLWRAAGCPEPTSTTCAFTDVKTSEYYYKAVLWAVETGITKGTSDTTFSPDANVSRSQTVTFLARMSGVKDDATGYSHNFADVYATDYFNNAVAWAATNKITEGTSATTFSPNDDCLRGQIVTFLYRNFVK